MKKLQTTGIAIALVSTIAFSGMALAEHHKGGQMFKRMAHHLNMDDAQKEQAKAIHAEMRPHLMELYEERRELRKALGEAIRNGASQGEIDALAQQQGDNYAQLVSKRAELKSRIHGLLSDEQRAELEQAREKRMERKQQRREKMKQRREERRSQQEGA